MRTFAYAVPKHVNGEFIDDVKTYYVVRDKAKRVYS